MTLSKVKSSTTRKNSVTGDAVNAETPEAIVIDSWTPIKTRTLHEEVGDVAQLAFGNVDFHQVQPNTESPMSASIRYKRSYDMRAGCEVTVFELFGYSPDDEDYTEGLHTIFVKWDNQRELVFDMDTGLLHDEEGVTLSQNSLDDFKHALAEVTNVE